MKTLMTSIYQMIKKIWTKTLMFKTTEWYRPAISTTKTFTVLINARKWSTKIWFLIKNKQNISLNQKLFFRAVSISSKTMICSIRPFFQMTIGRLQNIHMIKTISRWDMASIFQNKPEYLSAANYFLFNSIQQGWILPLKTHFRVKITI